MSAFLDTSAFLAILDADDPHNRQATEAWARVLGRQEPIHTTNYVVVETVSLLHRRFGVSAVRRFHNDVVPVLTISWVDGQTHDAAVRLVLAGPREGQSLVDCVSFDVIARLRTDTVLAFDRHFRQRGFTA